MVCRDFILPEICKPCLFIFAKLIVPYRNGYCSGYRPRRLDTRMGTMYLMVPKVRQDGYIPFFVTERKRSEAALIQVVQEAFVQGVSTRKMGKLAQSLGIQN
ncbi:transposase [Butyricicoccus pullicaecorum]|nr:transposase [Butyricicoccus pullicaecorum]